jgi:hypothetical protein
MLESAHKPLSGIKLCPGPLTLLVGATGVLVELQDVLNTIWKVPPSSQSSLESCKESHCIVGNAAGRPLLLLSLA